MGKGGVGYIRGLGFVIVGLLLVELVISMLVEGIAFSWFYPVSAVIGGLTAWVCYLIDKKMPGINSISMSFFIKLVVYGGFVLYCHYFDVAEMLVYGTHIVVLYLLLMFVEIRRKYSSVRSKH
ncbi:MAG: hypothetical protein ACK5IQ_11690 [Bacteroidales bacterium]